MMNMMDCCMRSGMGIKSVGRKGRKRGGGDSHKFGRGPQITRGILTYLWLLGMGDMIDHLCKEVFHKTVPKYSLIR